jgi:cell fate (sporulation/competence/biofilm development) regulator YlbF (YheA/YmcA/DUF963 family)
MTATDNSAVLGKTLELCNTIISQPEFATLRQQLDAFMEDERIQAAYRELSERGSALHVKQQSGEALVEAEIQEFERRRERFLQNPVARGFLEAQQTVQEVRETVGRYVTRTFELGRVPTPEDFHSCGCGSGCGCG